MSEDYEDEQTPQDSREAKRSTRRRRAAKPKQPTGPSVAETPEEQADHDLEDPEPEAPAAQDVGSEADREVLQRDLEARRAAARQEQMEMAGTTDEAFGDFDPAEEYAKAQAPQGQGSQAAMSADDMLEAARVKAQEAADQHAMQSTPMPRETPQQAAQGQNVEGPQKTPPSEMGQVGGPPTGYLVDTDLIGALQAVREMPMAEVDAKLDELAGLLGMRQQAVTEQQRRRLALLTVLQIKQDW